MRRSSALARGFAPLRSFNAPASALFTTRRTLTTSATGASQLAVGVGKLNHVAIAVPDLEQATSLYRDVMGATVSEPLALAEHGVTTVFIELGNTKLELLHPLGENSPIANFLKTKPSGGIHHICLEVKDIHAALEVLKAKGIRAIDQQPKIGAHGKPVVFCHPKDLNGVLVELEQV